MTATEGYRAREKQIEYGVPASAGAGTEDAEHLTNMAFQSTELATIIDVLIIGAVVYALLQFARVQRHIGSKLTRLSSLAVFSGLTAICLSYTAALVLEFFPTGATPDSTGSILVDALQHQHPWMVMPFGILAIAAGFHANSKLVRRLFADLRDSESRLQDFANSSSDWFWEMGPDLKFKYFSELYSKLVGSPANRHIGVTPAELLSDKDTYCSAEAVDAHLAELEAHRPFRNFTYAILTDNERTVHIRISGVPVFGPAGEFKGYRGTGSDITESKLAETRHIENEALFHSILDNSPSSINLKDPERRFVFVNKCFEKQYNLRREDIIGRHVTDIFPNNFAQIYADLDAMMLATRQAVTREVPVPHFDGAIHTVLATKFPVHNARGQLVGIGSIGTDITAIKTRETELAEKSAQLQTILDTVPARISIFDDNDRFTFANSLTAQFYGTSVEELMGCTPQEILGDRYPPQFDQFIRIIRESTQPVSIPRYQSKLFPGTTFWVLGAPVVGQNGESHGVLTVAFDVTEQQKAEDQLRQSQKMEVVGQLTGGIAHDFNNLLAIIICNLDVMAELLPEEDKLQVLVEEAITAAENGAKLNDRLLAFSRQQSLSPEVLNLNDDISKLLEMLQRVLGETIVVEARLADGLWDIDVDPTLVETALLNVAINARDAMPAGGTLLIETANTRIDEKASKRISHLEAGEYVKLTLTDTGTGMSPEFIDHAFEPFFTTKEAGHGTGLGLSMVFGFARQSGGHVTLDSELGKGTTVTFYLPRARRAVAVPRVSKQEFPSGRGETILVVEDEEKLRSLYAAMLKGIGYLVLEAKDGASALKVLAEEPGVDLLLSDVVLPGGMSGLDIASAAKEKYPYIKLLYMSGYPRDILSRQGTLTDPTGIIRKPFQKADIARRLRNILNSEPVDLHAAAPDSLQAVANS
jgi:PAS domain S-box-containing protein